MFENSKGILRNSRRLKGLSVQQNGNISLASKLIIYRESVAGSVIQATGTVEFEDGLRTGVLPGGCWCPCGGRTQPRIKSKPPWGCGLVLGAVWLSKRSPVRPNSNSAEFRASVVLNYSCCGVRIELAVGSLPYPRQSGTPTVWQKGVQPPLGQRLYPK